jgi:membrane protein implicated in regulation of membrane protease activity
MVDFQLFQISAAQIWFAVGILIAATELLFPTEVSMWSGLAAWIVALLIWIGLLDEYSVRWQLFWFAVFTIAFVLLLVLCN